ncbi:MAG: S8 family serine peptidase, partial [Bacteroidota bacterium]
GVTNNKEGIASITWNVKFLPTSHSSPNYNYIEKGYEGIVYLAEMGCDVINCSWGGGGYSASEAESIRYATTLGSIVICAAGNDNSSANFFPACYPKIISIASVSSKDTRAYYSNYGKGVDIAAPGGDNGVDGGIMSTVLKGQYTRYQGTSMASPAAAGVFGYIKSFHPKWTNEQIIKQILGSATDIDTLNKNYINQLGAGRVNAFNALTVQNADVPRKLRLELIRVNVVDSLNIGPFQPGHSADLGFIIRNYAHYVKSDKVHFLLESLDPQVTVTKSEYTATIYADSNTYLPPEFQIKISENATSRFAKLKLTVTCDDAEIIFGAEMQFEIPIISGGILVFDGALNTRGFSGAFISSFLKRQGFDYIYTDKFPTSLDGYGAVFLCFGAQGYTDGGGSRVVGFDDWMAEIVKKYLVKGTGNLYIEGTEVFGWDQRNDKEFLKMMGIQSTEDGDDNSTLDTLIGNPNAITNGMFFVGSRFTSLNSIDKIFVGDGKVAFVEPSYGQSAVQNLFPKGGKTFGSVYPMTELYDRADPNNRYELISRIMEYFGMPTKYSVPNFSTNPLTGHAPLKIKFTESTLSNTPTTSWNWDFLNRGNSDSKLQSPEFTYTEPGTYQPKLVISNVDHQYSVNRNVYVFDGESALDFNGSSSSAEVDSLPVLNLTNKITIEAWIYPRNAGYMPRIVDKDSYMFFIHSDRSLRFYTLNENGKKGEIFTKPNLITYNTWNHVAATFDGDSTIKLYINGVEQENINQTVPKGKMTDNKGKKLYIGNKLWGGRAFNGSIDEVRIWNFVKTLPQLKSTMNNKLTGNETGLVAYWRFQEGNGTTTQDLTRNNISARVLCDWRQGWHEGLVLTNLPNQILCKGSTGNFSVETSTTFSQCEFQWQKNGAPLQDGGRISGATSKTLRITNLQEADSALYSVNVKDVPSGKTGSSNPFRLFIKPNVNITKQPEKNKTIFESQKLEMDVEATGSGILYYQWYNDGFAILGATSNTFISNENVVKYSDSYFYCTITNDCGTVTSDTLFLTVITDVDEEIQKNTNDIIIVYPNPFDNTLTVALNLQEGGQVNLGIYDVLGNEEMNIKNEFLAEGRHVFNLKNALANSANGVYYCVLNTSKGRFVKAVYKLK